MDGTSYLSEDKIRQRFLKKDHEFSDEEFEKMIKMVIGDGVEEFVEDWFKGE